MKTQTATTIPPSTPTYTSFDQFNGDYRRLIQRIRNAIENARRLR